MMTKVGLENANHDLQKNRSMGTLVYTSYGVDLTFDSDENEGYGGGILIRAIEGCTKQAEYTF